MKKLAGFIQKKSSKFGEKPISLKEQLCDVFSPHNWINLPKTKQRNYFQSMMLFCPELWLSISN